jgi:hypothetical protein
MSRLNLVEPGGNDQIVEKVFEEVIKAEGWLDPLTQSLANYPPALLLNWEKTKALLYGGNISSQLKHEISALISEQKGCSS